VATSVNLPGTSESFTHTGVPLGLYTFTLRARNVLGESASSNTVTLAFPGACTSPSSPVGLTASVVGSVVTLAWSAGAGGGAATSYRIEAGSAPGQADLAVVNTGPTQTTFSTPAPRGTYHVRLRAVNACGTTAPTVDLTVTVM
jgi:large repetitive protein